ncbi:MAG: DUF4115 domain-containing protein [candidate division Zixibacteria bacterium]|nr:DUF4115 domain-containing protein [candidate division Zixibacteria bacterium]
MSIVEEKLGALLKLERERKGVKLDELAESLRIPVANLECIERGDVSKLPSEIYFGLFAKSYAEAVGVDYAATVLAIEDDLKDTPEPPKSTKKPVRPARDEPVSDDENVTTIAESRFGIDRDMWRKLMWAGAATVLVVGGFLVGRQLLRDMQRTTDISASATQEVSETTSPAPVGSREESYANYDWNVPAYEEPDELKLKLTARGSCWAAVFADGDTAIYRNLVAGRVYEVTAKYRLTLSVAVPRIVDIDLNGVRINPVSPSTGRIKMVRITQVNVDSFLNPPSLEPAAEETPTNPKPEIITPVNVLPETGDEIDTLRGLLNLLMGTGNEANTTSSPESLPSEINNEVDSASLPVGANDGR